MQDFWAAAKCGDSAIYGYTPYIAGDGHFAAAFLYAREGEKPPVWQAKKKVERISIKDAKKGRNFIRKYGIMSAKGVFLCAQQGFFAAQL